MSSRTVGAAKPLVDVREKEWQHDVVDLAKKLGWTRVYHVFDSRRSTHGFPDWVLVRDRVIFLELKREKTQLTDEQAGWLRDLRAAGAEAYVARPRHLEPLGRVLARRGYVRSELDAITAAELGL